MTASLSLVGRLFFELLFDILRAPIWWYTEGIVWVIRRLAGMLRDTWQRSSIGIWMRNLFVPMYGQHDIWGRIISFFIRFANIIGRMIWMIVWFVFVIILFAFWLAAPIAAAGLLVYSFLQI